MRAQVISFAAFEKELNAALASGRITFLVGAGVSMLAPSCQPSGPALKNLAIEAICAPREMRTVLNRVRQSPRYRDITPEVLFQRIYACLDRKQFLAFFDVLRFSEPNALHHVLGRATKSRNVHVLTTNFDDLIERADGRPSRITHLHGVLTQPGSMVTRINQVGRGINAAVSLAARPTLLCVLGYSGNDDDVLALVRRARPKRVLWLARSRKDWAWRNIRRYASEHEVAVAHGNLERLWPLPRRSVQPDSSTSDKQRRGREDAIERWGTLPRLIDRFAIMTEVLFEIEDYKSVVRLSRTAMLHAKGSELAGWFRIQMGEALRIVGRFSEAEKAARQAIRINSRLGDPFDIAGAYNLLGVILAERPRPDGRRARNATLHALRILDAVELRTCSLHMREALVVFRGRVLNNVGLAEYILGNHLGATTHYGRALQVKRKVGDMLGEAITAGNLSVAYFHAGDAGKAALWKKHAFVLMDKYELRREKGYVLRCTGTIACERGDVTEGQQLLREAIYVYRSVTGLEFEVKRTSALLRQSNRQYPAARSYES
ncbi:MAG: hypothetical protein JWM95_725 [Gemmatimonadetes bacterium]|nr:hypothetical protein [Gemmatimonadota bacterium]